MSLRVTGVVNALLLVVALVATGAGGCSGKAEKDSGLPEAGTDAAAESGLPFPEAGPFDAWAPPPPPAGDSGTSLIGSDMSDFGPAFYADMMVVPDDTVGHDLDGDGTVDNAFGSLPLGLPGINSLLTTGIADGSFVVLLELRGLDDPTLPADDFTLDLAWYAGAVTATPGEYVIQPASLDASGFARSVLYDTTITGTGTPSVLLAASGGTLARFAFGFDLVLPEFTATAIASVPSGPVDELASGLLGGVLQACSLSMLADPFLGSDSTLELLVGLGVAPDIDLSGDGLETFNLAPGLPARIESCTDGDGTTVIPTLPGRPCACDERIEDGLSFAAEIHAVAATIMGIQ